MPFKAWGPRQIFMVAAMLVIALGAWAGPIVQPSLQTITGAALTSAAAGYAAWRYIQARQRLKREHVAYLPSWKTNVFCVDESTRKRWSVGVQARIEAALAEVEKRTQTMRLNGINIRLVSHPFSFHGLPGRNRGVYDGQGGVVLWWPETDVGPQVMLFEFARVVAARDFGLFGNEAAAYIHREWSF